MKNENADKLDDANELDVKDVEKIEEENEISKISVCEEEKEISNTSDNEGEKEISKTSDDVSDTEISKTSDNEGENEKLNKNNDRSPENVSEEKEDKNINLEEENVIEDKVDQSDTGTLNKNAIAECSENNTDIKGDKITVENIICSSTNRDNIVNSKVGEFEEIKNQLDSKVDALEIITNNDVVKCPNDKESYNVVDMCNDVPIRKLSESEKESSNNAVVEFTCNLETTEKSIVDDVILHKPKVQPCNNIVPLDTKENENVPNNYDKTNLIQTETKQYNDQVVLSSKFKGDTVETDVRIFNNPVPCNNFSKTDITVQPSISSVTDKQYSNNCTMITNDYCKPSLDSSLLSNVKQYSGESLPNDYNKTSTAVLPNPKQYGETLMNEYRKLDMLQPEMNKQMYNKEDSVEFIKNSQVLPAPINSSQEVFKVVEQSKSKVSEKNYSHSIVGDHSITVPKYDNVKQEKQSKRTTLSPKTVPYRLPTEVPQVDKSRLHDYLPPMGFLNYQKINNSIAMSHSEIPKTTKDMYADKKTDAVNINLPKEKEVMNLPKTMDNSLLYSSVMQQSPYTDQSMMHLSLHHHLAHSSQYHHSPPVPAQVPPPVHQTKSRSKKSEQRRLAQQNQTPVAPSTQQPAPPPIPSHTQSYHHHHQTATYMMPQPTPSSPYHHSVIQHRMGQQGGSCSSADFYLSHPNQHAAAAAAQIASCNLSKLQQMTNGLDHHRRHIASPASSPASSPANMTPPPPAASAAAAHLLQQSAVAYHKLYQQAGQTNQSRQYSHQTRGSPASPNVGLMTMQYGAPPPPFNGYRVASQSTPPPSAASYMNQTTGQLQYTTHTQDPHHQNSVYPTSAYNGSYLQPLNGSMHR